LARAQTGCVAAGHQVTAEAAADILQDGGNAFDACIAGLWAACAAEPVFCAPGGGGFMMAKAAGRDPVLHDFFVDTPLKKSADSGLDFRDIEVDFGTTTQNFHIGAGSTATPGLVAGLFDLADRYATRPMRVLAEPAIHAAKKGVRISAFQAYLFQVVKPIYQASESAKALFTGTAGGLPGEGDVFHNPALADCLDALSREGSRLFYEGEIAQIILDAQDTQGGQLSREDLRAYRVQKRFPLHIPYGTSSVYLNPPPSAGGTLVGLGLKLLGDLAPDPVTLLHVMEATNNIRHKSGPEDDLLDEELLARYRAEVMDRAQAPRGTTHISVIDAQGHAAAATVSNGEGNGDVLPGCGFMLNNMLGEEDLNPMGFQAWTEGERMSSMMAPTIVSEGDHVMALGSGGSNRIRTALLQVLAQTINGGLRLEDAVNAPRMHLEKDGRLSFEDMFREDAREALLKAYPQARIFPNHNLFFGGVHAALRQENGSFEGAGDPRRAGVSITV